MRVPITEKMRFDEFGSRRARAAPDRIPLGEAVGGPTTSWVIRSCRAFRFAPERRQRAGTLTQASVA